MKLKKEEEKEEDATTEHADGNDRFTFFMFTWLSA